MPRLNPLSPHALTPPVRPAARSAERVAGSDAAGWLADAAHQAGGSRLHVSPHDPGLSLDRIEQDFIAALCEAPSAR